MKFKSLLFLPIMCMVLGGCDLVASDNLFAKDYTYEEKREIIEETLDDVPVEVIDYQGSLDPLPLQETKFDPEKESLIKFKEGDEDKIIQVSLIEQAETPFVNHYTPKDGDVVLVDENDNAVPFDYLSYDSGIAYYRVPVSEFSEDHFYHLGLTNNSLKFVKKDKSIRDLTFYSLEVNDENRRNSYNYNDKTWPNYDLSTVQYFDIDAFGAYFISNNRIKLNDGDMFRIADLSVEGDNRDTVYGKFISCEKNPNGSGYIVRYQPCNGQDIYDNIDINDQVTVSEDNISNFECYTDDETVEQRLARGFLHHPDTVSAVLGLAEHYNLQPRQFRGSVLDWASKIQVSFDLHFEDSTFTWGAQLSLNINPTDYLNVKIVLSYKQTTKYDVSASVDIDYALIVPVGIDYKLQVKEDDTKEISFKIVLSTSWCPYDEDAIREGIEEDLKQAIAKNSNLTSKFTGASPTASAEGVSYPLLKFDFTYFFPLDIRFEVDFYWQLQLTFETDITYISHSQRVDVSLSNKKGADPSSETVTETDKELRMYFMGTLHAEVGLRVSFGLGIAGLYKFFHAEIFIKAFGAVDAQGYLLIDLTWSDSGAHDMGTLGGKFEITAGVKWGVDIDYLFGSFDCDWPVKVWTLVGFATDNSLNKFIEEEDTLEITDKDYGAGVSVDLDQYHYLYCESFDAQSFETYFTDFKFDDTVTTRYGEWLEPNEKRFFSATVFDDKEKEEEGSQWIALDGFKLSIIGDIYGVPEFTAYVKVTVNPDLICSDRDEVSKLITVHFTNNLKQTIYVKEPDSEEKTCIGTYVEGQSTALPIPNPPKYMKFVGWKNLTDESVIEYNPDNPTSAKYQVPHLSEANEVTFEYQYVPHYYYDVTWVDGLGNIVKIDKVYNDETVVEIDPAVRDRYMISNDPNYEYVFVGYDTDITNLTPTQNMTIRAIYEYRQKASA